MAESTEPVVSADVSKEEEGKEGERKEKKDGKGDEEQKRRPVKSPKGKGRGRWTRDADQTTEKAVNEERKESERKDEDKDQESKRREGRGKNMRQNRKRNRRARYKARKKAATEKDLNEELPPIPGDGRGPNEKKEGAKQKQLPDTNIEQSEPEPNFDSDVPMHYESKCILQSVMSLAGLRQVKKAFLQLCAEIRVKRMQDPSLNDCMLGAAFLGNPGTGMTCFFLFSFFSLFFFFTILSFLHPSLHLFLLSAYHL